ncbi:Predicted ATPase [Paramicrobacterium humi]|uniref:Predicted ATPase n=1 Tax=Paramicrobacterium humi TaxID=640635 RepID=A0A1H4IQX4_9MICO|nr:BTAD domain-containing putative transcriptional regulator [Microbacterium humi]SEB36383.1 Predicted ATPase [Microbacterium humi]
MTTDLSRARAASDSELGDALALWRGEPGADLGDAPVAADLRTEADRLRHRLEQRHAEELLADGRFDEAATILETLVRAAPLDEPIAVLRMRALDAAGRRNDALAAFAALRDALADALGTDPGPEAVAANAALLRASDAPRVRIGVRAATQPLLGRAADVAAVEADVRQHRLTTILGVGGLGKTSLAQEVARRSTLPRVAVVELAGTSSADDIMLTVAATLGIRTVTSVKRLADPLIRTDLRTRVATALGETETLLVLDNCEHLVDAAAAIARELLADVPGLRILATSRAPLSIAGEQVLPLLPLAASDADSAAVALFLERARAVRPQAELDIAAVVRICERLDGLPLAIELAAARVRVMSLDDIERRLRDRFALLTTVDRAAPERHRTLFAVIDWSWKLLEPAQRTLLQRLSLFSDGFTADAAAAVSGAGDVIDDLDALVMQSLVTVREESGGVRFRMLETVREFGRDRLADSGESKRVERAHLEWARAFCLERQPLLFGHAQLETMRAMTAETENLITVLRRAVASESAEVALAMFGALATFWSMRGDHEEVVSFGGDVVRLARRAEFTAADADAASIGLLIAALTFQFMEQPRVAMPAVGAVRRLWRAGLARDSRVGALLALILAIGGIHDEPQMAHVAETLEAIAAGDDAAAASIAAMFGANIAENNGELETALRLAHRTNRLAGTLGDTWLAAGSAMTLAQLYCENARPGDAEKWCLVAREGLTAIGALQDVRQVEWMLAVARVQRGDDALAHQLFDDDADLGGELRSIGSAVLAEIDMREGRPDAAAALYDAAVRSFAAPRERSSPWFAMALATHIIASLDAGAPRDGVAADVRRLRSRVRATLRLRPLGADQPILGAALLGLSRWALDAVPTLSLELLALAEVMTSRQDFTPLRREAHLAYAERTFGEAAVTAVRAHTAELGILGRVRRADELLADPRWRER